MLNFAVSYEEFLLKYFEQQPLLRAGALTEPSMTWSDLDSLLYTLEPDEQVLQMFFDGQVPPEAFLEPTFELGRHRKRINKSRFYELLASGATLVINRFEDFSVPAKRLCTSVGQFAQQSTTSNAYVSFDGSGSFGQHWDTHDVFAIQMIGQKRWQLYPPTLPLPLSHQTSRQNGPPPAGAPVVDCVLGPGDVLYIPRGWWHQVTPLDVASLHLSVGTYPATVADYLQWLCNRQLPQSLDARRGCLTTDTIAAALENVLQTIGDAAFDRANMSEFLRSTRARDRLTGEFQTALILDESDQALNRATRVSLTFVYPVNTAQGEVAINGGRLKLSPVSRALVELLSHSGTLAWGELCDRLSEYPQWVLRDAVIDLARHDLLNVMAAG